MKFPANVLPSQRYRIHQTPEFSANELEWLHLSWYATVPSLGRGSFPYLIWQLLQRNSQKYALIAQYYPESFAVAQQSDNLVTHIEMVDYAIWAWMLRMKQRILRQPRDHPFVKIMAQLIIEIGCEKAILWDGMSWSLKLRKYLPNHFLAFAQRHYRYQITKTTYNAFDLNIMQTRGQVELAFDRVSKIRGLVVVIPNGVELEQFQPADTQKRNELRQLLNIPPDKFIVIIPSRLAEKKGTHYLEQWIKQMATKEPNIIFLIVGYFTDYYPNHHRLRLEPLLKTSPNVRWISDATRYDMPRYYQVADVALFPNTLYEGFSLAACEAMASGVPVIAPNTGCFPEIVYPDYNGVLFRQNYMLGDVPIVLSTLRQEKSYVAQMGRNARQYAILRLSREKQLKNFELALDGQYDSIDEDLSKPS